MTNVEYVLKLKTEAGHEYYIGNSKKGEKMNKKANDFAERNFSEEDFDEYISTRHGLEKSMMIQWKNEVLQRRERKQSTFNFNKQLRY